MLTNTITTFVSYASRWPSVLKHIVEDNELHSKWVNTLSFLENCGAKKISISEHPTQVKKEVLKHAAEEFRHAFYLKTQISRISDQPFLDYSLEKMLGSYSVKYYLHLLDLRTCKILKNRYHLAGQTLKTTAYVLVTSAIEMRAAELYSIYHTILKQAGSKVTIKSIILEEQEHLEEMESELAALPHAKELLSYTCKIESALCLQLVSYLEKLVEQTCKI